MFYVISVLLVFYAGPPAAVAVAARARLVELGVVELLLGRPLSCRHLAAISPTLISKEQFNISYHILPEG